MSSRQRVRTREAQAIIRIELALALVAAFAIALAASRREASGFLWGSITLLLCSGGICICAFPLLRVAAGAAVAGCAFAFGRSRDL